MPSGDPTLMNSALLPFILAHFAFVLGSCLPWLSGFGGLLPRSARLSMMLIFVLAIPIAGVSGAPGPSAGDLIAPFIGPDSVRNAASHSAIGEWWTVVLGPFGYGLIVGFSVAASAAAVRWFGAALDALLTTERGAPGIEYDLRNGTGYRGLSGLNGATIESLVGISFFLVLLHALPSILESVAGFVAAGHRGAGVGSMRDLGIEVIKASGRAMFLWSWSLLLPFAALILSAHIVAVLVVRTVPQIFHPELLRSVLHPVILLALVALWTDLPIRFEEMAKESGAMVSRPIAGRDGASAPPHGEVHDGR